MAAAARRASGGSARLVRIAGTLAPSTIPAAQATRTLAALRGGMSDEVRLWLGGSGARDLEPSLHRQ